MNRKNIFSLLIIAALLILTSCGAAGEQQANSPQTAAGAEQFGSEVGGSNQTQEQSHSDTEQDPRIVDPENHGWPRQVMTQNGLVTIEKKPERIHTLSLGYDEITLHLVDVDRMAAIGTAATNPAMSNVVALAEQVPHIITRDAEQILAAEPDIVVASPFAQAELVSLLLEAGVTVVQIDLVDSIEGHENNIRFLAYVYGEEERGEQLIQQVRARLAFVQERLSTIPDSERPRVLRLIGKNNTPGKGSNQDGIIRAAGGINVAAEAGLERHQNISLEAIAELNPDVIVLNEIDLVNPEIKNELLGHPALQHLPVLKENRVYQVQTSYFTTLSHWNIRGVEMLAGILYPDLFQDVNFDDFTY